MLDKKDYCINQSLPLQNNKENIIIKDAHNSVNDSALKGWTTANDAFSFND